MFPNNIEFFLEKLVHLFVHFLDKLDKNVSPEIPRIFLVPRQGISFFSSFLTRNLKPRKMRCVLMTIVEVTVTTTFILLFVNELMTIMLCNSHQSSYFIFCNWIGHRYGA